MSPMIVFCPSAYRMLLSGSLDLVDLAGSEKLDATRGQ